MSTPDLMARLEEIQGKGLPIRPGPDHTTLIDCILLSLIKAS